MFEIIFLIAITLYFIQVFVFSVFIRKKFPKLKDEELPTATIIVAARNEEENILRCIQSLDKCEYPDGKLEIVIVDDNSTDNTFNIVEEYIRGKEKFKLIKTEKQFDNIKGKANAIANGIENSSGEIILTTDADCIVHPKWAKTLASYYTEDVGMVCGYTNQTTDSLFSTIQSIDFLYLMSVAAGTMNLKKPTSCIGNNMSYRRKVYEEVGGYQALPFSVTEDFQLLMAVNKLGKYQIIYPMDKNALVTSNACKDVKSLYWQKKRWGVGGWEAPPFAFMVMGTGWFTHACIVLSPFFFSLNVFYFIFVKLLLDYFLLKHIHN
ncbi:MAG: glycosyltransferase, partial [Ignavibacteria bacterium]